MAKKNAVEVSLQPNGRISFKAHGRKLELENIGQSMIYVSFAGD